MEETVRALLLRYAGGINNLLAVVLKESETSEDAAKLLNMCNMARRLEHDIWSFKKLEGI